MDLLANPWSRFTLTITVNGFHRLESCDEGKYNMLEASSHYMGRLDRLRKCLEESKAERFLSLSPADNQYLTGFLGDTSAVIVTQNEAIFVCDSRYIEQAGEQVVGCAVEEVRGNLVNQVGKRLRQLGVGSVAFDPASLTVAQSNAIQETFPGNLKPIPNIVSSLRMIKSPEEVERIRAASQLTEQVLNKVVGALAAPVAERELAALIEYEFKKSGAAGAAFDTIALFGPRSSLPHGQPGDTPLQPGDVVLLDLGCRMDGYCSDLTRTYAYGTISGAWFEEIYQATLAAQRAALAVIRPGIRCKEADAIARDIISEAGYAKEFGHGLGHGVGIEIHESPALNTESDTELKAGMVITVEPGIYLPGRGGVRIEDLVLVTKDGCEVLTRAPKELRVLKG